MERVLLTNLKEEHLKELFFRTIRNEEISTVFQPIISLQDGGVLGYEALSRGPSNTPLQNPEKLFAYAMEHDQLWDLEYLCRTKALESAHRLQSAGKLFLNVNPNIMSDAKFKHGFTRKYLSKYQIDSDKIVFEITEKEAISKLSQLKKTVNHYKEQHYQIAIDDVGSGYSGLNILTDIHPHFMKLDMKLIRDIDSDSTKQSLVKSLCEFALVSQIHIIAEGIETKDELSTLIALGVHFGQGYFIQKPNSILLPISEEVVDIIIDVNSRKRKKVLNQKRDTFIGGISTPLQTLDATTLIDEVNSMMAQNNSVPGLCVIRENRLVGVITRNQLHFRMSGAYGYSLDRNKTIQEIMDTKFLQVDVNTPIHRVAKLAMMRDPERLYDLITITKDGQYFGIVTVKELLEKTM